VSEKSGSAAASKSDNSSKTKSAVPSKELAKSTDSGSNAKDSHKASPKDPDKASPKDSDKASAKKSEKGKSQKETVSSADVHYGYFSSVRTPAYRKGWDEIFGKKEDSSTSKASNDGDRQPTRRKKKALIKQPLTLELDFGELSDELRVALRDEVKRKIKPKRINFDKRNAAGAVRWNITCEIKR